jgi:hypothetical protein
MSFFLPHFVDEEFVSDSDDSVIASEEDGPLNQQQKDYLRREIDGTVQHIKMKLARMMGLREGYLIEKVAEALVKKGERIRLLKGRLSMVSREKRNLHFEKERLQIELHQSLSQLPIILYDPQQPKIPNEILVLVMPHLT